jgi:hypothetical protein
VSIDPPKFQPHGASRFERRGQVLILRSQGPFNAEHIQSLAPAFREYGGALKRDGPWATINVISTSMMVTPEGLAMLRASAQWTHDQLGRVAAAYVALPGAEGRFIMEAGIRASCAGIMPLEIFDDVDAAEAWALERIAEARGAA